MARHVGGLTLADIDGIVELAAQRLVQAAHPDKILLFGSYARGDFDGGSDLDLLVILPSVEDRAEEMVRLRRVLKGIPSRSGGAQAFAGNHALLRPTRGQGAS